MEFEITDGLASIGTTFSKVSNLSGDGDSFCQYGSLIVSCDVLGSSSLTLAEGERVAGVPKIFLVSPTGENAAQFLILKIWMNLDRGTLLRKRR